MILSENFLNTPNISDYNGYPIIFLYRHAFELSLKNIIYKVMNLENLKGKEEVNLKLHNTHDLIALADCVKMLIGKFYMHEKSLIALGDQIGEAATEFHEIDPNSFAYRYPINRQGGHSTEKHQIINIAAVRLAMDRLLAELEIFNFGVDIELSLEMKFIGELAQRILAEE